MRKLIFINDLRHDLDQVVRDEKPDLISFLQENRLAGEIRQQLEASTYHIQYTRFKDTVGHLGRNIQNKHICIVPYVEEKHINAGLMQFIDQDDVIVLAQKTTRFFLDNPLFLISIPKSGSHLLYRLAELLGFERGMTFRDFPKPGKWYYLEFSNSHTKAKDFFIDSVRQGAFGNRQHPFLNSPALFIYRNPLDILVSEANYYHIKDNTLFSGYFANKKFKERVDILINDPHLLGSIRDRVNEFVPWLQFPNVIPLSFEELVGAQGEGEQHLQHNLIWSIQLKLQIPGETQSFAKDLFDSSSPTFMKGKVGQYRNALSQEQFQRIRRLDQDFMDAFGYRSHDLESSTIFSERIEQFRRRPLEYVTLSQEKTPVQIETELFGYNIIRYNKQFYAFPCGKNIDIRDYLENHDAETLLNDASLEQLKYRVAHYVLREQRPAD